MMRRDQVFPMLVSAVLASGVSVGTQQATKPASRAEVVHTSAPSPKQARLVWPGLEQAQVDALTAELRKLEKPTRVLLLCRDSSRCGDLALDIENAMETARWNVQIDVPLSDDTTGISVTSSALALALRSTTGLEAEVAAPRKDGIVLVVLGKRPR